MEDWTTLQPQNILITSLERISTINSSRIIYDVKDWAKPQPQSMLINSKELRSNTNCCVNAPNNDNNIKKFSTNTCVLGHHKKLPLLQENYKL